MSTYTTVEDTPEDEATKLARTEYHEPYHGIRSIATIFNDAWQRACGRVAKLGSLGVPHLPVRSTSNLKKALARTQSHGSRNMP